MAKYPTLSPDWADKPHGTDSDAWEEARQQCRSVLIEWARSKRFGTYTELARAVTAISWPEGAFTHHGQQMGYLLGQVSLAELDRVEDRPVLSALVVGVEEGMPSTGFWNFLDTLDVKVDRSESARLSFWVREFEAACKYYG